MRLRLPVVVGVGAKDAFAQRGRTILTVSSLALAAALVATAMGFEATMDRLASDPALRAQPYELRVESSLPGRRGRSPARPPRRGDRGRARARDRHDRTRPDRDPRARARRAAGAFRYAIRDGRAARAPGEVTLGRGALDALRRADRRPRGAARGGQPVSLRVVGRHVEPDDDGRGAVTSLSGLPAGVARLDDPYWGVRLSPGADPVATAAALTREGRGRLGVERPIESLEREAADMRPVVYGTVALLIVIAALNLLTTLGLAVRERERDYAVLASVGATPRQVRSVGDRGRRRAGAAGGAASGSRSGRGSSCS